MMNCFFFKASRDHQTFSAIVERIPVKSHVCVRFVGRDFLDPTS